MDMGYDTSLSLRSRPIMKRTAPPTPTTSCKEALISCSVTILCDAAEQEGYTLSEEGQQSVED